MLINIHAPFYYDRFSCIHFWMYFHFLFGTFIASVDRCYAVLVLLEITLCTADQCADSTDCSTLLRSIKCYFNYRRMGAINSLL